MSAFVNGKSLRVCSRCETEKISVTKQITNFFFSRNTQKTRLFFIFTRRESTTHLKLNATTSHGALVFFFFCYRFFVVFIRVEKERHLARTTGEEDDVVVVEKKRTERDDECDTECVFWKQR